MISNIYRHNTAELFPQTKTNEPKMEDIFCNKMVFLEHLDELCVFYIILKNRDS